MTEQKVRAMYCTVCGGQYMGRQFHNQDTGYGLGDCCANFIRTHRPFSEKAMSTEEIERTYGRKGYHYEIEGAPSLGDYYAQIFGVAQA